MKTQISAVIAAAAVATVSTLATAPAFAVNDLQLNSTGGSYILSSEDTTNPLGDIFTLNAYCKNSNNNNCTNQTRRVQGRNVTIPADNYFLSIALLNSDLSRVTSVPSSFGSFSIQPTTPSGSVTTYTAADFSVGGPNGLPTHGVYDTAFKEISLGNFIGSPTTASVNVQDTPGFDPLNNPGNALFFESFKFDISNLSSNYRLAIDLYSKNADGSVKNNAPFSHNFLSSQGGKNPFEPPTRRVPEPASLFGLGLVATGMVMARRRRNFANN